MTSPLKKAHLGVSQHRLGDVLPAGGVSQDRCNSSLGERALGCGRWSSALTEPFRLYVRSLARSVKRGGLLSKPKASSVNGSKNPLAHCFGRAKQPPERPYCFRRARRVPERSFLTGLEEVANERGVVLLLVLWIFIFLSVVAFDFTSSVREEGFAARRYAEETEGYYLALAGFQRGLYELLKNASEPRPVGGPEPKDLFAEECLEGDLGEGSYRACLVDEGGKINLNLADEELLRRVFTNLGVEAPRRDILVDSILDWRDSDDLHRLNGAESDYYQSLSPAYTAKNGPFDAVEELLWVRGVTAELFYGSEGQVGFREIFTVESPMNQVNLRTASAEVCVALLGIPLERCRAFVEDRKKLSQKTAADVLSLLGIAAGDAALRRFVVTIPFMISVEAAGRPAGSDLERRVRGVVRVGGGQRGFELIRWIDRDIGKTEG